MEKLKELLAKLSMRQDLANHAVYGVALYWAGAWYAPVVGLGLAVLFGIGKELLIDKKLGLGQFDVADILATVALPVLLFIQQTREIPQWIQ